MAKRLSIAEERAIADYMRDHPSASVRSVAHRFGRSRPTIADLRRRYALDRPIVPDSSEESGTTSEVNQGSRWLLKELAETDRATAAWYHSLPAAEQEALDRAGRPTPGSDPGVKETSFLDAPHGSFEEVQP